MVYLGTLKGELTICQYTSSGAFIGQAGCYNLVPVFQWINRCIISIFLVFLIAYLPLFLQGMLPYSRFWLCKAEGSCQNWWSVVLGKQSFV